MASDEHDSEAESLSRPTYKVLSDDLPPPPRRTTASESPQFPKHLAGYELGDEIGRGGMGVVIQARDPQLDRPVALKLILAGAYCERETRERFLVEARVTARVKHPNIVQIFEVGEENGIPFMALELIEGGTLARLIAGRPLDPRHAAEIVEKLARAVGYAHSRDVIHRDLKPANVLLAADGPKVVDFGVAEVLDSEATAKTGLLAGTPSYMAPEQALRNKRIGPPADIYALGAILYECLTSRPPFKAATPLATLDLVRAQPPVAPMDLQPGVPRDLNTICLKCLEKEPARRYSSAEALADDLGRFLRGEPIVGRPVGRTERLWRWMWRNPRDAGLLAALFAILTAGLVTALWLYDQSEGRRVQIQGLYIESENRKTEAEKARAASDANFRELQKAVENTVYMVNTIDLAELFNLRMLPVRKELLEPPLRANRAFLWLHGDNVEREPEVVAAHFRVAILVRLMLPPGNSPEAAAAVAEALEIGRESLNRQQKFVAAHPDVIQYKRDLAAGFHNVGWLTHRLGQSQEAVSFLTAARRIREDLCDNQPENLDYQSELAGVLNDIGLAWYVIAKEKNDPALYSTAEQLFRSARDRQRKVASEAPHVLRYRILRSMHAYNLAKLIAELGRGAEALPLLDEMLAAYPDDAEVVLRAARLLVLIAEGTAEEAAREAHLARAVTLVEKAFLEMPNRPSGAPLVYRELKRLQHRSDFKGFLARFEASSATGSVPSGNTASGPDPATPPQAPRQ